MGKLTRYSLARGSISHWEQVLRFYSLALLPVRFLLTSEDVSSQFPALTTMPALMYSVLLLLGPQAKINSFCKSLWATKFYHRDRKVTNGYVHVWGYFILHTYDSQLTTHHGGKTGQELEVGALGLFPGLSSASFL